MVKRFGGVEKYDVCHSYALNLDPQKCLWFYYYGELGEITSKMFYLVYSRKEKNVVFTPDIHGSHGFAVSRDHKRLLLGGGYKDNESVYFV